MGRKAASKAKKPGTKGGIIPAASNIVSGDFPETDPQVEKEVTDLRLKSIRSFKKGASAKVPTRL